MIRPLSVVTVPVASVVRANNVSTPGTVRVDFRLNVPDSAVARPNDAPLAKNSTDWAPAVEAASAASVMVSPGCTTDPSSGDVIEATGASAGFTVTVEGALKIRFPWSSAARATTE